MVVIVKRVADGAELEFPGGVVVVAGQLVALAPRVAEDLEAQGMLGPGEPAGDVALLLARQGGADDA